MKRILDFFLPRERKFYDLLLACSQNSLSAAEKLREFMQGFSSYSEKELVLNSEQIHDLEKKGDEINRQITRELHSTFITPIDREDIHTLANLLDDQADLIDNVTKKLTYYQVKEIEPLMIKQMDLAIEQLHELHSAIEKLEHGHSIEHHHNRVIALEDEADIVHRKAISKLFSDSVPAVEVMKLKDIYETLEILTDKNQHVAIVLESIVIKHA